jgi:hypothetical protein
VATPGDYTLLARATSDAGRVQPLEHDAGNGGYLIHHARPRPVRVAGTRRVHDQRSDVELLFYDMNAYAEQNSRLPLDVEMEFSGGGGI